MPRTVKSGWFHFVDDIAIDGVGVSPFVIGRAWMIEFVDLTSGTMSFVVDGREVVPERTRFGIYYAPFCVISLGIDHPMGKVEGFGSVGSLPNTPDIPMLFDASSSDPDDLDALLSLARSGKPILQNSIPTLHSVRAKRIIDARYSEDVSIAEIAAEAGISHEHLTRQFRKDFDLSPLEYLHKLRMAEANLKLSEGNEIITVSSEVGYNDLSRFYKQFRKEHKTTPGNCRTIFQAVDQK